LRQIVTAQAYLSNYLDSRFRPTVQWMSKQSGFLQSGVATRAKARGQEPPSLDAARDLIQEALTQRGINEQADRWLKESRGGCTSQNSQTKARNDARNAAPKMEMAAPHGVGAWNQAHADRGWSDHFFRKWRGKSVPEASVDQTTKCNDRARPKCNHFPSSGSRFEPRLRDWSFTGKNRTERRRSLARKRLTRFED